MVTNDRNKTRQKLWWRLAHWLWRWEQQIALGRKMAPVLISLAVFSGLATYVVVTDADKFGANSVSASTLLKVDLVLLLLLSAVIIHHIARIWGERRSGSAGSKLHVRLVVLFSIVTITPTILVAVFSMLFFNLGVQNWFSERVQTALGESRAVARSYLAEHQRQIGGDALAMANDLNRDGSILIRSPQRFMQIVLAQAALRGLTEVIVFDTAGRILAKTGFAFSMELSIEQIPLWAYEKARNGEVAILTTDEDDRVRALVHLEGMFSDAFLYVGRFVDPKVIAHMERTEEAVSAYEDLERIHSSLEVTFSALFAVVALLLLLAAVWIGLNLATRLAHPIAELIDAAERIRSGDLSARVYDLGSDEIGLLSRAFNRMTRQLSDQHQELMTANRELDERRRFTETVLEGVSAGVIGLDVHGIIELPNRSACDLLGCEPETLIGRPLDAVFPEMAEQLGQLVRTPDRLFQKEIKVLFQGRPRTLLVRLATERLEDDNIIIGYVLTFDDVTELVSAQRKAAWADIARRIAHEIKNPLTPIQLSAERLRRKYLKEIKSDPEIFITCTDTIVRQVGDIGRMVDEFSAFARMPVPIMKPENLCSLVHQTVFLAQSGYAAIRFEEKVPSEDIVITCDGRQISQALTNLLKNAVEAIEARQEKMTVQGRVIVSVARNHDIVRITVDDNGRGLPQEQRDVLTEPYVTTRVKGTGLGLAIVKKIMEDHQGELTLEDLPLGDSELDGARVILIFHAEHDGMEMKPLEETNGITLHGA